MFSKACEYAIKAVIYIASQSSNNKKVSLKEIAGAIESPVAFTAKILQKLSKNQILDSSMGKAGGFVISEKKMKQIKLIDIVTAIDGNHLFVACGLGLKECSAKKPCPVHDQFQTIRQSLKEMLKTTSIYDLSLGLENGLTFLKR